MSAAVDLTPAQLDTMRSLLAKHLPDTEAWLYGSRVGWTSRPQSDLDMVVFASSEQERAVGDLREAFEESDLPFRVDLFVWSEVPVSFQKRIEEEHAVLAKPPIFTKRRSKMRLGECIVMNEEKYSPKEEWPFVNYLDTGNITGNRIKEIQCLKLNEVGLPSRARCKIKHGDIVYSMVRPNQRHFGLLRDIPENFLASTGFAVFQARGDVADTGFIYWFLAQEQIINQLHIVAEHSTSAYPSIRPSDIKSLNIELPPIPEQRAIAHVLGTLDDKIELNRRMNQTLEAMARVVFKDWFVDFGPVKAKMEGHEPYLPSEIWELFPDTMDDEDKPFGWEISEIGKEVNIMGGATPSTKEPAYWQNGGVHWATPKDLSKLVTPVLLDTERKITDTGAKKISSGLLPVGTVLLSSRAPIGYLAITAVRSAVNQGFIAMVCEKRLPNTFVLYWCCENVDYIKSIACGSTFSEISKRVFRPIPVVVPTASVIAEFEGIVRPIYDRIIENEKETMSLAVSRSTLLPKLISGELRVHDIEHLVEAIT